MSGCRHLPAARTAFFHPPTFRNYVPCERELVGDRRHQRANVESGAAFFQAPVYQVMPFAAPSLSTSSIVFDHVQNELSVMPSNSASRRAAHAVIGAVAVVRVVLDLANCGYGLKF